MDLKGLSNKEVEQRVAQGLINKTTDSYTPSFLSIVLANIFNVINVVITPLLVFLFILGLRAEVGSFAIFLVFNTVISIFDEIRIKREISKLKTQFQARAGVIRNGELVELPVSEIVKGDLIKAVEGDAIAADGVIRESKFLQLDESNLTGESDYLKKDTKDKVFAGSFVVTGECYYQVTEVGSSNFTNKLATASTKFQKVKSKMQQNSDRLISVLIILAIAIGVFNFVMTGLNPSLDIRTRVLGVTSVTALVIPQTLIFLFTLTFSISIYKLYKKGVLVQKGAAIENLTNINVICLDKTGTITTNQMLLVKNELHHVSAETLGSVYASVSNFLFGVSKTQKLILDYLPKDKVYPVQNFDQVPFTSQNKYSMVSGTLEKTDGLEDFTLLLGAYDVIKHKIDRELELQLSKQVAAAEELGQRTIVIIYFTKRYATFADIQGVSEKAAFFSFEEELNLGISKILRDFQDLGIRVKVISGDSKGSVETIVKKVGLTAMNIIDLSKLEPGQLDEALILKTDIFTRAKPEDKLNIVNTMKSKGMQVAMVGDGINDVLSLKAANVSIAMESGAKVTRGIADIVLLKNDYQKLPAIFYEGDNIIFNLRVSSQMFLAKSILALLLGLVISFIRQPFPIHPSATLIFSFLSSSLPSYILIFTRSKVRNGKDFFKEIYKSAIPAGIILALTMLGSYFFFRNYNLNEVELNTALMLVALGSSMVYSLVLLWDTKKIRNLWWILIAFIFAYLIGALETLLPLSWVELRAYWGMILATLLILSTTILCIGFYLGKPKTTGKKLLYIIGSFAWYPVVLLPFRGFYHVETLHWAYYFGILGTGLVALLALTIVKKRLRKRR